MSACRPDPCGCRWKLLLRNLGACCRRVEATELWAIPGPEGDVHKALVALQQAVSDNEHATRAQWAEWMTLDARVERLVQDSDGDPR